MLHLVGRGPVQGLLPFVWVVPCRVDLSPALIVADLSPSLPAPVLASGLKAGIQFHSNGPAVQHGGREIGNGQQSVLPVDILYKTKPAGRLLEAIHSHDDPSDGTDLRKMGLDVIGTRRKGHVANVDGARYSQGLHLGLWGIVVGSIPVELFVLGAVGE